MVKGRLIALPIVLCALLLAVSAGGRAGAASVIPTDLYWLGPYFAGMRMTHESESRAFQTFAYGDCDPPPGEGGCGVPAQIQTASSCTRNPIGLDRLPYEVFLLRGGGLAAVYEPTGIDVGTGRETVTVFANYELMGAALRDFHLQSQSGPQPLPPPIYPLPVLRELKRVTAVQGRFAGVGAIARVTGLTPAEVRLRLAIAELLGPEALAGVPAPTMSVATVERLRQLSFDVQLSGLARTAREHGMSIASLRTKVRRVRGLGMDC
jgi:hypothetical protein